VTKYQSGCVSSATKLDCRVAKEKKLLSALKTCNRMQVNIHAAVLENSLSKSTHHRPNGCNVLAMTSRRHWLAASDL